MSSPMYTSRIKDPIRIVIPAYKASDTIDACLRHVLAACDQCTDAEVVVVSYKTTITHPFDHRVHIIESARPLNAGEARNAGSKFCGDRILVFVDADVLILPGSLPALLQPIRAQIADATVGNYATDMISRKFFQNYKKLYIHQAYARDGVIANEFWTAYSAIRGQAFDAVGGFSTSFTFKGGEDTEIGIRLSANGFRIYAVAAALGQHLKEFTFRSLVENDLIKGSRTIYLSLQRRLPLSENRHAKKSDQYAVMAACVIALIACLGLWMHWIWLFLPFTMGVYLMTRTTFFMACSRQGNLFLLRAACMAWVLDIVRACSVVNGILVYVWMSRVHPERMMNREEHRPAMQTAPHH